MIPETKMQKQLRQILRCAQHATSSTPPQPPPARAHPCKRRKTTCVREIVPLVDGEICGRRWRRRRQGNRLRWRTWLVSLEYNYARAKFATWPFAYVALCHDASRRCRSRRCRYGTVQLHVDSLVRAMPSWRRDHLLKLCTDNVRVFGGGGKELHKTVHA